MAQTQEPYVGPSNLSINTTGTPNPLNAALDAILSHVSAFQIDKVGRAGL